MACGNLRELTARETDGCWTGGYVCGVRARACVPIAGRPRCAVPSARSAISFSIYKLFNQLPSQCQTMRGTRLSLYPLSSYYSRRRLLRTQHHTGLRYPTRVLHASTDRSPGVGVNFIRVKLCNDLKGPPPSCLYICVI